MGAASWPALSESTKASPKSSSSDLLKVLSDGSVSVSQDEEEQLYSGTKEDSIVSEASQRAVQNEEERLFLQNKSAYEEIERNKLPHGKEVVSVPAIGEANTIDATGARDLFASGFLYGLVKGLSLKECCRVGSCSCGSVIGSLGGDVTPESCQWMYNQMQTKGLPITDPSKRSLAK